MDEIVKNLITNIQSDVKMQLQSFSRHIDVMRDDCNYVKAIVTKCNRDIERMHNTTAFKYELEAQLLELIYKNQGNEKVLFDLNVCKDVLKKYGMI